MVFPVTNDKTVVYYLEKYFTVIDLILITSTLTLIGLSY